MSTKFNTKMVASKKATKGAFNMGDEGDYVDDGIDDGYADELDRFESGTTGWGTKKRSGPSERTKKQMAADAEYQRQKEMGFAGDQEGGGSWFDQKAQRAAKKIEQQIEQELQEKLAADAEAKARRKYLRSKKYLHSSERKMDLWNQKKESRVKFEEEWAEKEEEHREKCDAFRELKEAHDRQCKIDASWAPKAKPKPKPKPKGKGKKGGGPPPDLAKMFGGNVAVAALKEKEEPAAEKLPWDPEKGDKDPQRPSEEKKEEKKEFERLEKAHRTYLTAWSKAVADHNAELEDRKKAGEYKYDLDSDPEFESSDYSSESEEDSDDSDYY
eukprot:TRINITY_DN67478_c2_g1_i1.p2 TRINITY_DN67478_c2_g1~~TRINITY_DN67478_c2_g1_i1.p2  ORF type:complete len:328 (-),score=69.36 TRINITY_DN67478_c2_g1_i1:1278-2261(-)